MSDWPVTDHSILSPSGHISKRARNAALERARRELFGDGLPFPTCKQPTKRESLLRQARNLRELAARGMSPRAFNKEADRLEKQAADLTA